MNVFNLTPGQAVAVDVAVWTVLGFAVGLWGNQLPASRLGTDAGPTQLHPFEEGGRVYQRRLRIDAWKDRLPDAGTWLPKGSGKRVLGRDREEGLASLAVETRRAELVHWTLLTASPLFVLWNPPALALVMLGYGAVSNLPFIAIQRYNRARIYRIQRRRGGDRRESPLAEDPTTYG